MSTADHWMYNQTRGLFKVNYMNGPEAAGVGDFYYNPHNLPQFWVCLTNEATGIVKWTQASEDEAKQMKTYLLLEGVSIAD